MILHRLPHEPTAFLRDFAVSFAGRGVASDRVRAEMFGP
jgi:hypothetical protein